MERVITRDEGKESSEVEWRGTDGEGRGIDIDEEVIMEEVVRPGSVVCRGRSVR